VTAQQARIRAIRITDPAVDEAAARYDVTVAALLHARRPRDFERLMREAAMAASVALIQNARRMGVSV
jgi:hypothetical protein